ncbi:hypothetical protein C7999DRAFT_17404 [Corynascus novoguineensis]|uniref:C2H2-type domain-containing protein n=1 Tax=Corynascus novoguineensis TaxID=1126955 RepID=A0AAN7CM57_9PEZI|nr:hypothetical protein C7999DRAFT_17404 [Corynascus novoguineensis]
MDPTIPEFRPQGLTSQATGDELRTSTTEETQWRTTCRTCGETFKSRNQLMRHLYRNHPGKPAKGKSSPPKTSQPFPVPHALATPKPAKSQSQSQVHPFSLLSPQQQLAFAGHVMRAIFAVGIRQLKQERGKQQWQPIRIREMESFPESSRPTQYTQEELVSVTQKSRTAIEPQRGTACARTPNEVYRGKVEEGSGSEDSDDEDGGVALFGPSTEELPLRLGQNESVADSPRVSYHDLECDWDLD